ncbi:MAG: glycine cleavage system aminomethyltransferase GcvT [Planctomycetota bacterium]
MHRTPVHPFHLEHGAKMVDFAGWEMPLTYRIELEEGGAYGGVHAEHKQVRESGGFFDVSHMGRVSIKGRHARRLVEKLVSRRISDMEPKQCRYALVLNQDGGVKDDVLVYRLADDDFLLVVNAANREKLLGHFEVVKESIDGAVVKIEDRTFKTAMVAIQGPNVMEVVSKFSKEIPSLKRYRFTEKNLFVMKLIVSRTGYTGEDGVEVILPAGSVKMALNLLMKDLGKPGEATVKPAGLGARDTLRLEAGMALYGHELGEDIPALASGLGFAMTIDKDEDERGEPYVGMEAVKRLRDAGGPERTLVGLFVEGKRTARPHCPVVTTAGDEIGEVTSGCVSPTLERCIAMAYVHRDHAAEGTALRVRTEKGELEAAIAPMPFYKPGK